jgi:hypothetical protein
LYIAQDSLKELETHWLISQRVELASPQSVNPILNQCESVGRLLLTLIRALEIDTPVALMRGILGSLTQVVLTGIATNQNRA